MDKKIFLIGFVLFLFGSAHAVQLTGDFLLETDCSAPASATYILRNNSSATETYTISAIGENRDWINLNGKWIGLEPLKITLGSGSSKEIYAFVKPQDCYVVPGLYTLRIEISNGTTIIEEIIIEVTETRKLEVSLVQETKLVSQCESAEFKINIKNTGEKSEIVTVDIENVPKAWVKLSSTELFLEKGKEKQVMLELQPECNASAKKHEFKVKTGLKGTSFFAIKTGSIVIEDQQEINFLAPALTACAEKETTKTIKISNNGLLEDSLNLSVEGTQWVNVKEKNIVLAPRESKEVEIVFEEGHSIGSYEFVLKAHSTRFNKDSEKEIVFGLLDCYNIEIESVEILGMQTGGIPNICLEENPIYVISLKNNALEAIEADVKVVGIDAIISPGKISLESEETIELRIEIDLENEKDGKKVFTLQINGESFSLEQDFEFQAEDCYNLSVDWDGLTETIALDANCKSSLFTIVVENNGTKEQEFSVENTGTSWIYFEPVSQNIAPGEVKEVYLFFSPPYDTKEGKHTAMLSVGGMDGKNSRKIEMTVFGGLYADLGTGSVKTDAKVEEVIETVERMAKIFVQLSNDSNSVIRVTGIKATDLNAVFDFKETVLLPEETIEIPMELYLGTENQETEFLVKLEIETDKGTMQREIEIDLDGKPEEPFLVGLAGLGGIGDWLLAIIVILIIAIFATVALKSEMQARKPESGLKHLADEVAQLPGKKLEEIGKKNKSSKQGRNLQDIVKEVNRKHPASKKPAVKKK